MAKKPTKTTKYETITRVLPVELEDKQIQEHGEKLASLEIQLQTAREESAAEAARWRERKKALSKEIAVETKTVDTGTEERPVVCDLIPDYRTNKMDIVRQDTRETIDTRALTVDERQLELGGKPKSPKGEPFNPALRPEDLAKGKKRGKMPPPAMCTAADGAMVCAKTLNHDGDHVFGARDLDIEDAPPLAPKGRRKYGREKHNDANGVQETAE